MNCLYKSSSARGRSFVRRNKLRRLIVSCRCVRKFVIQDEKLGKRAIAILVVEKELE